jgi:dTDP-4-amino-4,6-dideoxygalactose transaminase
LGTIGHLAALSFHETKNVISGEGGALIVNDTRFSGRAEMIREKGTNRSSFVRGEVDKYTWVDIGSSYLPSEIVAAYLLAQLEQSDRLLVERRSVWERYHAGFAALEERGQCRRPIVPPECDHNAHLYYLLLPDAASRNSLIAQLRKKGIHAPFHYVPLHNSPAGIRVARTSGALSHTEDVANRLVRLPIWYGMTDEPERVIDAVRALLR